MIGLGCMRLSTDAGRDDARALEVVTAALDAGVDLLDTADTYALDDNDVGHNERLIARATAGRRVELVTKGGLVRPEGAWLPLGKARHLDAAARASRERLGRIDIYLLHAVDPRTPLATSVRALAKLRDAGVVGQIGLSNVGLHQLDQALAITRIDAVEIELSPWRVDAIRGGLVAACLQRGIRVLAHRPLGGAAGAKRLERALGELARSADATPCELALAWLCRMGVVPLPGATRIETARSAGRASRLVLDDELVRMLDARFLEIVEMPQHAAAAEREVVMIVGMPAAGKSTLAADYAARGYVRLNRDERGGTLIELARALDRELAAGTARVVLDNTYGTRASRAPVVEIARRHGATAHCVVTATSLEQAQANAVTRMLEQHGRLLQPAELGRAGMIAPSAQFRYRRSYEPPRADEGFARIDEVAFSPRATSGQAALIVELDNIVWCKRTRELVPGARDALARWHDAGYALAGTTWQTSVELDALLDVPIAIARCPHPAGPPVCWCRKPLPGLALWLAREHGFDLGKSVHLGKGPADRGFALRAGLRYVDIADGWPTPATSRS